MNQKQYERVTREIRNQVFSFVGERKEELEQEISEVEKKEQEGSLTQELEQHYLSLWRIYIKYFPTKERAEEYLYYRFPYQLSDRQKQLLLL